jgi:hypothetical protein
VYCVTQNIGFSFIASPEYGSSIAQEDCIGRTYHDSYQLPSSFSKVLEKVMYKQLQDRLNKHNILAQEHFGFRSDSTTNKAIYKLINEALNALNSKLIVGGIFFDLEKAFDCLNHDILVSKLQFYGVNGIARSWFVSYPQNRYMRVQITDEGWNQSRFSAWKK